LGKMALWSAVISANPAHARRSSWWSCFMVLGSLFRRAFLWLLLPCFNEMFLSLCANSDQRCFPFIYVSNVVPMFSQTDQKLIELIWFNMRFMI
jgi:hypothetical protein